VHVRIRLETDPSDMIREIGQVDARPRPDFYDCALEVGEELPLAVTVEAVLRFVAERQTVRK